MKRQDLQDHAMIVQRVLERAKGMPNDPTSVELLQMLQHEYRHAEEIIETED